MLLVEPTIPALRRYNRSLLKDQTSADDLVQDTLERAITRGVLLQMLDPGKRGAEERRLQAATSKSPATKAVCACLSRPPTL